jgi:predicted DCC family thiol-disulfide oxidoreductase YuxK
MNSLQPQQHPVILFDGVCNLCSGAVQFIIKHDPHQHFRFASLQSELGQQVLAKYQLPTQDFESFILWENEKLYTKSTGALRVAKKMNRLFSLWYIFIIVPPFIRDGIYHFIAKNRYQWFGKKTACWIPTPSLKRLFLDQDN